MNRKVFYTSYIYPGAQLSVCPPAHLSVSHHLKNIFLCKTFIHTERTRHCVGGTAIYLDKDSCCTHTCVNSTWIRNLQRYGRNAQVTREPIVFPGCISKRKGQENKGKIHSVPCEVDGWVPVSSRLLKRQLSFKNRCEGGEKH